jgi:hypothetical protein
MSNSLIHQNGTKTQDAFVGWETVYVQKFSAASKAVPRCNGGHDNLEFCVNTFVGFSGRSAPHPVPESPHWE